MNAIATEDIPALLHETVKGFVNGLVRLKRDGVDIDPMDSRLDFSILVLRPNGLNAIVRTTTSKTDGERVSVQNTPAIVEITEQGPTSSATSTLEGGKQSTETSTTIPNLVTNQTQTYGRQTETVIDYENG